MGGGPNMKIIKRIDNIAFEWSDFNQKYQIIQFYPNAYYGELETYIKNGYKQEDEFLTKPGHSIAISFFTKKELNYVIAFLDKTSDGWEMRTVGARPFDLLEDQFETFRQICRFAFEYLDNSSEEQKYES
jgi:hypothetical protein